MFISRLFILTLFVLVFQSQIHGGSKSSYTAMITKYSTLYNVDPILVSSIIKVESNFNENAVSRCGAVGLMQIIPSTELLLLRNVNLNKKNLREPEYNIKLGVIYLSILTKKYNGNLDLILAEYNGGPNCTIRYPSRANRSVIHYVYSVKKVYEESLSYAKL